MRTPSGDLHVVDFKTEQIVTDIQPKDYWGDKRHWELKNNIDTLDFTVFDNTKHAATLMQQNLVLKEVRDGRIVPYVITEVEKNSTDRSVTVYASGEWILLDKAGYIMPQKIEGKTVNEFIDMALPGTKWKRGHTEYAGFHTMTIDEPISPLKFLKNIASLFELEIVYRCEVVGSQIVSRYVDMVKKRGRNTGKEVTLGKDLIGIQRIENSQNICTALVGFVKKEGGEVLTIADINNGLPYIVDNDAFQRWNEKGQHKFAFYSPETSDQDMTSKRLKTLMETEMKKHINTSVSYEVQSQSIGRVFGLNHEMINEGDEIRIKDTGFTPKLYLEARAIAGDESFTNPTQDKYVFGDYREIVDQNEELRKMYNRIRSSLGSKANKELLEQLEKLAEQAKGEAEQAIRESQAAKDVSQKLKENIEQNMVEIIESANPPTTNLKPNKTLWRDISNGRPGILKIWTGAVWETVAPDIEPLKQEIESTKTELNKKVEAVQNEQGEVNQKIVEMEKTNVGFKTSIEELTKKDAEITDKMNTIENTVEGTKQTISDIQSTTDGLTKTTNEMKQTVDTNSSTIQKVQQNQSIISKDMTQVKQSVGSLETTVKNVTEAQTEQGQVISQQSSQIKQLSNEVSSKVTAKQVEEYIGGIGSQNKLINAIFTEKKIDDKGNELSKTPSYKGWKVYNGAGGIVQPDSSLTKDNDYTIRVQVSGQTANRYYGISQTIPCQPGEQLVASVYIYAKDKSVIDQNGALELKFYNGNTHVKQFSKEFEFVNHNWVRIVLPVTAPNEPITQVEFRLQLRRNGEIWFAHPMLQNGTKPSSFFPNPKDLTNYQETLDKLADKVATEEFNRKTTELYSAIEQTNESIKSKVGRTEVYTKEQANEQFATNAYVKTMESVIEQQADSIKSTVKKGEIISTINQSAENIKIIADIIDLVGKVEASWIKAGLLQGTTVKTSNTKEHIHMENQVLRFVNQGAAKIVIGFEDEHQSKTFNPYIILGEGDGTGRNVGTIYKDANGVYYRFIDLNGMENSLRLTAQGNVGITAQTSMWLNSKGSFILDGKNAVAINHAGKTVAEFIQVNGVNFDILLGGNHRIRSSTASGYDKLLQIKNSNGNEFRGIEVAEVTAHGGIRANTNLWAEQNSYAMQHINRSTEKIKTSIHDLPFSPLEKVRELKVKQYFLKRDMYELYQMRMNKPEDRIEPYTIADVETQYGFIAEETDDIFTTPEKDGIKLYSTLSILTAAVQELEMKYNEKIQMMEEQHKVEMAEMNRRIEVLEQLLVDKLIDKKAEQQ